MSPREASQRRKTSETDIRVAIRLDDGGGGDSIETGVPFFDHLLASLARHSGMQLTVECRGDVHVDDHHSVEDTAILIGRCLDEALGERRGIARFGSCYAPLDEALVRAVVDLSGRPYARMDLPWRRPTIGGMAMENVGHALATFATAARMCLHVDTLFGDNDHHKAEAAFKAVALALRDAIAIRPGQQGRVPSTKETL